MRAPSLHNERVRDVFDVALGYAPACLTGSARTHARTHAHTHARTRAHTRARVRQDKDGALSLSEFQGVCGVLDMQHNGMCALSLEPGTGEKERTDS